MKQARLQKTFVLALAICCLLYTSYQHKREQEQKGRKLHISDERFFREAEKMLYDEFALVLHIQPDQVLPFILEQIQLAGKNR